MIRGTDDARLRAQLRGHADAWRRIGTAVPARALARLRGESGVALVLSLGTLTVLSLALTTSLSLSGSATTHANRSNADQAAYALAESGINNAFAVLKAPGVDPTVSTLLPARTTTYSGGTVTWSGTLSGTVWSVTATGSVANPTGPGMSAIARRTTAKANVVTTSGAATTNLVWSYLLSTKTGTPCNAANKTGDTVLHDSVQISFPLYAFGNLCMFDSAKFVQVSQGVAVAVGGRLELQSSSKVGDSGAGESISEAHIAGGCKNGSNPLHTPCLWGATDKVWATVHDSTLPAITVPTIDWSGWYNNSRPGPGHSCTTSSGTPPVFDGNGARDNSVATFDLVPTAGYVCQYWSGGTLLGEMSWGGDSGFAGIPAKQLRVSGTIFIDGSVKIANSTTNSYAGRGSIYLSGAFYENGSAKFCAKLSGNDCSWTGWNPNTDPMLYIVANGTPPADLSAAGMNAGNSIELAQSSKAQFGLWSTYQTQFGSSVQFSGPAEGNGLVFGNSTQIKPWGTVTVAPQGAPGGAADVVTLSDPYDFGG